MSKKPTLSRRELFVPAVAAASSALLARQPARAQDVAPDDQPLFEGIMQIAYIVPDLRQAMAEYSERLGIGPWFVTERFTAQNMRYRGEPTAPDVAIGLTYSGQMNVELIEQRDDTPSVYRDVFLERGYGFHHWGMATTDFEGDLEAYLARGDEAAFTMTLGSGSRLAYIDTTSLLPGMVELIEVNDNVRTAFGNMYRIARQWNGQMLIMGE